MDGYASLLSVFPESLQKVLQRVPSAQVHEIRLRAGQAVAVSTRGVEWYVTDSGELTERVSDAVHCDVAWLRDIVDRVCQQSVYAHGEELRYGFLLAPNGCRIGVAGTAVTECGRVVGYRQITSLCFRIAREHRGCASDLARFLCQRGVAGALVCGEPSSGKTTLLRDLIREFTQRRLSVAVVDERGELTGNGILIGCDILRGAPKADGIVQAIRCLAPRVVVFDELGDAEETEAVRKAVTCGVPVIASVHGRCPEEIYRRDALRPALTSGVFDYLVQLRGCHAPGEIASVIRTEEWNESGRNAVDLFGGNRLRYQR